MLLIVGLSLAQEVPAPGGGEPAKVEAPGGSAWGASGGGGEEGRSGSGTGAVYPRAFGTDRRGEGGDGHDVDLDYRDAGVLHEPRLRPVESGFLPGEELREHSFEELHCLRGHLDRLFGFGWGLTFGDGNPDIGTEGLLLVRVGR